MLACTLELVFVYREIAMIVYVCVCVSHVPELGIHENNI